MSIILLVVLASVVCVAIGKIGSERNGGVQTEMVGGSGSTSLQSYRKLRSIQGGSENPSRRAAPQSIEKSSIHNCSTGGHNHGNEPLCPRKDGKSAIAAGSTGLSLQTIFMELSRREISYRPIENQWREYYRAPIQKRTQVIIC